MKLHLPLLFALAVSLACSCRKLEYSPNQKFDKVTPQNLNGINLNRLLNTPGDDTIRFVLSGDSQRAYDDLEGFIKKVNELPGVDFVILNGDISDLASCRSLNGLNVIIQN